MNEQKYDLFLAYSQSDSTAVQQLASELSDAGIHVWLDQWELVPGQDWRQAQNQIMQYSKAVGICVGPRRSGRLDEQVQLSQSFVKQYNPLCTIITILLPGASSTNRPVVLNEGASIDFRKGVKSHKAISELKAVIFKEEALSQLSNELGEGDRLRDNNDLQGALVAYEQALTVALQKFGAEHPVVATVRNNIGSVQHELGDLKSAKREFEQSLVIDTFACGSSHPFVARDWHNLGKVLADLGEWKDARACYDRSLRISEEAYGPSHPLVAIILKPFRRFAERSG